MSNFGPELRKKQPAYVHGKHNTGIVVILASNKRLFQFAVYLSFMFTINKIKIDKFYVSLLYFPLNGFFYVLF